MNDEHKPSKPAPRRQRSRGRASAMPEWKASLQKPSKYRPRRVIIRVERESVSADAAGKHEPSRAAAVVKSPVFNKEKSALESLANVDGLMLHGDNVA